MSPVILPRKTGEGNREAVEGASARINPDLEARPRLRRKMSLPEILLWQAIRGRKLSGLLLRRQHPVGPYILDFYCAPARLAIEVDGASHETRADHDARRDAWLAEQGMRVLRIPALDVLKDTGLENVLESIARAAAPSTVSGGPPPPLRGEGSR
ncbi:MAG TPA: endonuclease domain-containing protein [Rhizomicrobium sp.]